MIDSEILFYFFKNKKDFYLFLNYIFSVILFFFFLKQEGWSSAFSYINEIIFSCTSLDLLQYPGLYNFDRNHKRGK